MEKIPRQIIIGILSILMVPLLIIMILLNDQINLKKENNHLKAKGLSYENEEKANDITEYLSGYSGSIRSVDKEVWDDLFPQNERYLHFLIDKWGKVIYISPDKSLYKNTDTWQSNPNDEFQIQDFNMDLVEGTEITLDGENVGELVTIVLTDFQEKRKVYFSIFIFLLFLMTSFFSFKIFHQVSGAIVKQYSYIREKYNRVSYEKEVYLEKYLRSERLVTMGRFASGIAHEIGNPLTSIMSSIQILKKYELNDQEKYQYYDQILGDAQKIDKILKEFLDFRKNRGDHKVKVDINSVIEETVKQIQEKRYTKTIDMVLDLDESIPEIIGDNERLQIVLSNIVQNAYQAIEKEGFIHIRTILVENGINIRIRDSGHGIGEKNIGKIFDPFFTTKEVGEGFGLGLFITSQIVHEHYGTIEVESIEGRGTIFTIYLPLEREDDHER